MANYEVVPPEMCRSCHQWAKSVLMRPTDVIGLTTRTFITQARREGWPVCPRCLAMANCLSSSLAKIDSCVRRGVGRALGDRIASYWAFHSFDDDYGAGPAISDTGSG